MNYGSTKQFTDWNEHDVHNWKTRLLYFLFFFIPRANPDNEKLYPKVKKWLLETDENDQPVREIALDKEGNVLFASPNKRNYGFWTDVEGPVRKHALAPIESDIFENLWRRASQNI